MLWEKIWPFKSVNTLLLIFKIDSILFSRKVAELMNVIVLWLMSAEVRAVLWLNEVRAVLWLKVLESNELSLFLAMFRTFSSLLLLNTTPSICLMSLLLKCRFGRCRLLLNWLGSSFEILLWLMFRCCRNRTDLKISTSSLDIILLLISSSLRGQQSRCLRNEKFSYLNKAKRRQSTVRFWSAQARW
jgi:hypothetical protein